jgi:hypothetical protein
MLRCVPGTAGMLVALAVLAGGAFGGAERAAAQCFGLMHMPTTFPQYLGYGYGAGHQAPIVRTPGYSPERMQRMAFAPRGCGPQCPAPYAPIGCYDGACSGCGMSPQSAYPPSAYQPSVGAPMPAQRQFVIQPQQVPFAPQVLAPPQALPPGVNGPVFAQPDPRYVWR